MDDAVMTGDAREQLPPLSERLRAVVSLVRSGSRAADIGCDHGYCAIWLRKRGISPFCICTDIREGPLQRARENIKRYGADGIETRIGDGLAPVSPGEADSILITGMGGALISRILEEGRAAACAAAELILGPQSEPEKTREAVYRLGFHITEEVFLCEDGKYYPVIRAAAGRETMPPGEAEMRYGPMLLKKRSPELWTFLSAEQRRCEQIFERLSAMDDQSREVRKRAEELQHDLALIKKAQEYYQ